MRQSRSQNISRVSMHDSNLPLDKHKKKSGRYACSLNEHKRDRSKKIRCWNGSRMDSENFPKTLA